MSKLRGIATAAAVAFMLAGSGGVALADPATTNQVAYPATHVARPARRVVRPTRHVARPVTHVVQPATPVAQPAPHVVRRRVARPTRAFDGLWSVAIFTRSGPCDPSYRYPARIVAGQVLQADNDFSYQLVGAVYRTGAISVTVSKGGQSATGYGRLYASRGGGLWSAAGGQCSGTWSALRRR